MGEGGRATSWTLFEKNLLYQYFQAFSRVGCVSLQRKLFMTLKTKFNNIFFKCVLNVINDLQKIMFKRLIPLKSVMFKKKLFGLRESWQF